ncbi:hypothetical protein PCE1_001600 [Barthelona sp. PCE]
MSFLFRGKQEDDSDERGPIVRELTNYGNTCYLNSLFQSLYSLDIMRYMFNSLDKHFEMYTNHLDPTDREFFKEFINFYNALGRRQNLRREVHPKKSFLRVLQKKLGVEFEIYQQQDTMELFHSINSIFEGILGSTLTSPNENLPTVKTSIFSFPFLGFMKNVVECDSCNHQTVSFDSFFDISLHLEYTKKRIFPFPFPFKKKEWPGLERCLELHFNKDELEGKVCDHCESEDKHSISHLISSSFKLPIVLMIHIKRFSFNRSMSKIGAHIPYPMELNMQQFFDSKVVNNPLYALKAVVVHQGGSHFGHFVAYIKRDDVWFFTSDRVIKEVTEERVLSQQAYVLFYEQVQKAPFDDPVFTFKSFDQKKKNVDFPSTTSVLSLSEHAMRAYCIESYRGFRQGCLLQCEHGRLVRENLLKQFAVFVDEKRGIPLEGVCKEEVCMDRALLDWEVKFVSQFELDHSLLYCAIDSDWVIAWRKYVRNDGEHPGAIANNNLVIHNQVIPGMSLSTHYRMIRPNVFYALQALYGGGPCVICNSIDIYDLKEIH